MNQPSMAKKPYQFLNANALRLIACVLMVLDHMWATLVPGNDWMTLAGRMAFPIFAFQIAEGYLHTSNWKRYAKRLLIFAIISEIPFDLVQGGTVLYPWDQNVMFTLLLGLLSIAALDRFKREKTVKRGIQALLAVVGCCLLAEITFVDYRSPGVLTVVAFWACRNFRGARLCQLVIMVLLHQFCFQGWYLPVNLFGYSFELQTQAFAVLALIPIWLYNGEKGRHRGRAVQYASYIFYPLQFLVLYAIQMLR